jgi:hypothetical protein
MAQIYGLNLMHAEKIVKLSRIYQEIKRNVKYFPIRIALGLKTSALFAFYYMWNSGLFYITPMDSSQFEDSKGHRCNGRN